MTVGIICEYNPLHLGHQKQLRMIREAYGPDAVIVCAMSGNFVQRGHPAIVDKTQRAQAAILCGADLVLELPVTVALSSAEGFAAGGVNVLSPLCDVLCFGAEDADGDALMAAARIQLEEPFPSLLRSCLDTGASFPAARQKAMEELGVDAALLSQPNNILAVEYCKAILCQKSAMDIFPIRRQGSYHAQDADPENPSATAVRRLMIGAEPWQASIPLPARSILEAAPLHTLEAGQRAILAKLRTMTDAEFEALPYGSEGLWRKFMHACRTETSLEDILTAAKSKRYTRSRLDRMAMCAFLGISREILEMDIPYVRILAFNDTGRKVLGRVKKNGFYINAGQAVRHDYWELEQRCGDLYGLFCAAAPEAPGAERKRRVSYLNKTNP